MINSPFQIKEIKRQKRKTISVVANADGTITIKAPKFLSEHEIEKFIWKNKIRIESIFKRIKLLKPLEICEGAKFYYMGEEFELVISSEIKHPFLFNGYQFLLSSKKLSKAKELLIKFYKTETLKIVMKILDELSKKKYFDIKSIKIRSGKNVLGSCNHRKKSLNFSWRLALIPPWVIEYVVIHELVHLEVPNHSKEFWLKVSNLFPDYRKANKWIRQNWHKIQIASNFQ